VSISTNIRSSYNQIRRTYRAIRARLRRARASMALLVVLVLALGEPLLCIVHCQIWIPFAYQSYFATQHAHMHHTSSHAMISAETATASSAASIAAALPESDSSCFMLRAVGNHDGAPFHVPPSPVHDLLPTPVVLILLVLLTSIYPAAVPRDPPNAPHPFQLRPPIPFAV
jgi:hypothetical protein